MATTRLTLKKTLPLFFGLFTVVALISVVANIDVIQNWLSKASGEPANIHVDVSADAGPLDMIWQNLAQGGEDHNWRIQPIQNQVKALKPQYIRIDHIYDFYDIVSRQNGALSYNWSKLDPVIGDIRATGATPYIALSYMPPAISSGDIVAPPTNWGEWQQVVQKTVEHISGRSGLNIPNVYYEVWNEPDLFGGWKTYGDRNYLTLYQYAANGARAAGNTQAYKIGGPATTGLYENWITALFDYAEKNHLRLDFYSWHRYAFDVDAYVNDVNLFKKVIRNYPNYFNVETHITEMGPDPKNNAVYDGTFSAAHLVAVSARMHPALSRMFPFEIQDGKDPNGQQRWGRWGLMYHQDFGSGTKPRYTALQLLNRLGPQRLTLTGQGGWVKAIAARKDKTYQLLLANYDPKSSHTETVPVTFQGITPGSFTLTQEVLGGGTKKVDLATTSASLKYELTMAPNAVALLELTQKP